MNQERYSSKNQVFNQIQDNRNNSNNETANLIVDEIDDTNNCKCPTNVQKHVTIKFFDKKVEVCSSNKDERCVINMSSLELSEPEKKLLLKG